MGFGEGGLSRWRGMAALACSGVSPHTGAMSGATPNPHPPVEYKPASDWYPRLPTPLQAALAADPGQHLDGDLRAALIRAGAFMLPIQTLGDADLRWIREHAVG